MDLEKRVQSLQDILVRLISENLLPEESYLAGGTALYYYLHHRLSIDLDFFTARVLNPEAYVASLRKVLETVDVELMEKETLIVFLASEKLKFSLFHLPYDLLSPLTPFEIKSGIICPLASLIDIEAMKALALSQRGSAKDFVDLFYLVQKTGHSFEDIARGVRTKYQVDEKYSYHLKTAMVYFDDAEPEIDAIWLVDRTEGIRTMSAEEWTKIKDFFMRFCQ